jgi:hypothetical protein
METLRFAEEESRSARLSRHPQLEGRVERLLDLVEDRRDEWRKADDAEERVIEELRGLGQELLQDWAQGQLGKRAEELEQTPGVWREGKKNSAGTPSSVWSKSPSHSTGKGRGGGAR